MNAHGSQISNIIYSAPPEFLPHCENINVATRSKHTRSLSFQTKHAAILNVQQLVSAIATVNMPFFINSHTLQFTECKNG